MPKQITTQEKQQKTRMMFVLSVKGMIHHFLMMAKKMKTILSLGYAVMDVHCGAIWPALVYVQMKLLVNGCVYTAKKFGNFRPN